MYRFLATPRWLGYAALTLLLSIVMIELGFWQLDRYSTRSRINARIDASTRADPVEVDRVLTAPTGPDGSLAPAGSVGPPPDAADTWTRVRLRGRYDRSNEILVRARTVDDRVGIEVLTPLVLDNGAAVLVDRGWLPAPAGGAGAPLSVPAPPDGEVTVVGAVRAPESRAGAVTRRAGRLETRRIAPAAVASVLPYPVYGGYVAAQQQSPAGGSGLVAVPADKQNALQNAGYVVQWWMFAAITVIGFGYLARREACGGLAPTGDRLGGDRLGGDRPTGDRLGTE